MHYSILINSNFIYGSLVEPIVIFRSDSEEPNIIEVENIGDPVYLHYLVDKHYESLHGEPCTEVKEIIMQQKEEMYSSTFSY